MSAQTVLTALAVVLIAVDLYLQIRESWRRYKKRKEDEWFNSL